ncbi:acyltransferase domain protein [Pacificimonas flava]|uniref:Acyltransferase domain protein n=1 Tax=Pacificimonas flava TaxID=1234595 RepID=M2U6K4_9SPHN|nr:acyltransferase domain protein [Pacificimonas flava]EMD83662.1 acyltransferase domain protein [Pacificimonas flava]MBB5280655.1 hypothetical protein [Pacificimonas flava]
MNLRDAGEPAPGIGLWQYVRRRNGLPAGAKGSLRNMLHRAFGASTLAGFWRHWNPIWSYGLSRFVFRPLIGFMPPWLAVVLTFAVSGLIHDSVIMALRSEPAFIFTPWFVLVAFGILVGEALNLKFADWSWRRRAAIHGFHLGLALCLSLLLSTALAA